MMDIEAILAQENVKATIDRATRKQLFVMPTTEKLPDDGILSFVVLESLFDVKSYKAGDVVQIPTDKYDVLKLIVENQVLFDVSLSSLTGVPAAEYDHAYDQATWNLERVSYSPLISELALDLEVEKQAAIDGETQHDRERRQVTRADGTIKDQSAFELAGASDEALDD